MQRAAVESRLAEAIVGSKSTVKAGLERLLRDTQADEVIVVTDTYEFADRLRSYELVSEVASEIAMAGKSGADTLARNLSA
jgi:alkanesulfonate monooxygenase SsuD/methylene tetrahydromethanopterin reductase-like flavin-dependent oxidoreductase (luciferase family)